MPEYFFYIGASVLIGAISFFPLILRLSESDYSISTVKDMVEILGLEFTLLIIATEFLKGILVSIIALNFWYQWQYLAVVGLLAAVVTQQLTCRKFRIGSMAIFSGGLLIVAPNVLKLFIALWFSMLVLTRNQPISLFTSLLSLSIIVWINKDPYYIFSFSTAYMIILGLTYWHSRG